MAPSGSFPTDAVKHAPAPPRPRPSRIPHAQGESFSVPREPAAPMPALFTDAFFEELVKRLNADADFKQKTGSVAATVLMVNTDTKTSYLLTVSKGAASWAKGNEQSKADFTFLGDSATWMSNHKGEAPMEKLVMTGKLKFKGSIPKIMSLRSQLGVIDKVAQGIPDA